MDTAYQGPLRSLALCSLAESPARQDCALSAASSQADSQWFLFEAIPSLDSGPEGSSETLIRAFKGEHGSRIQDTSQARTPSRYGSIFGDAQSVLSSGTSASGTAASKQQQNGEVHHWLELRTEQASLSCCPPRLACLQKHILN